MTMKTSTKLQLSTSFKQHSSNYLFTSTIWVARKINPSFIFSEAKMMGWHQHQVDHMQVICTSFHTDNHSMNKTKIMISGERQKRAQKAIRWPCGVCGRGVGCNSIQCTTCQKWVHKKCSGIRGSMLKVMKSFICEGCLNPVTSAGHTTPCVKKRPPFSYDCNFYKC